MLPSGHQQGEQSQARRDCDWEDLEHLKGQDGFFLIFAPSSHFHSSPLPIVPPSPPSPHSQAQQACVDLSSAALALPSQNNIQVAEMTLSTRGRQLLRCFASHFWNLFLGCQNVTGDLPGKMFKVTFPSSLQPPNPL